MHFRPYEPLNMTTELWGSVCPIEIPLEVLTPSQSYTCDWELPQGHSFCGDPFPHIVFYRGSFWISDGHNRVKEAAKKGEKTIEVRLKFKI